MQRSPNADGLWPRAAKRARPAWTLVALIAWTLFAFAGANLWTTLPLVAAAILLVFALRPPIARPPRRILDAALAACLLVVGLQLLPLPPGLRLALSPRVGILDQALWVGAPSNPQNGPARPLSIASSVSSNRPRTRSVLICMRAI